MNSTRRYNTPCTSVSVAADGALMAALYRLAREQRIRIGDLVRSAIDQTLRTDLAPFLPPDYFVDGGAQEHHSVQSDE